MRYVVISKRYKKCIPKKESKMRKKAVTQLSLFDHAINIFLCFINPEKILKKISGILDDNPEILNAVHRDLTKGKK